MLLLLFFPPPRISQISRGYFLKQNLDFSILHCLSVKNVSDHFRWGNVPVNQNKLSWFWSIFSSHMAPMFETLFLRLVHICEAFEYCSIQLSIDWNLFYETTDHLQQFRADKFSTLSRVKPLRSPRLVKLNSFNFDWKRCDPSKGFRALFVSCICSKNDSFLTVFSKVAFLSFTFFLQIIHNVP